MTHGINPLVLEQLLFFFFSPLILSKSKVFPALMKLQAALEDFC